ncbi:Threonine dehydratase, mitochondrial [Lachnellula hyalina]|uniref:Threonine dehydratase n=1 Tax=Lachnellula hyalina TaxID=1316788 RepID=A0A8H8U151_9HELO|nr:Threonine dehydratase, mitochondrial [Lachnellula hyalina]TVY28015.1 Threonine dehydratase, mitochondrial [Lachnellula hyalina]
MQNGLVNGNGNSHGSRPNTPIVVNNLSMTEYSANPSPPRTTPTSPKSKVRAVVPEEFVLPNGYPDYLRLILTSRVYEVVEETPLTHATNLSNRLECKVLLKREDLQPVFSFKLRGAYNKMAHLDKKVSWKGVVACSAGNHAQGVAYSARKLKIPATIVMPEGTPSIKHLNVSRLGGSVVLHGADFDAAKEECARLEKLHGLTNIPPFDDPYVIAGQGTIGMELLRQTNIQKLEAIFCCVGGGGLIAGIGVYVKRIAPHVKIIGVETYDANAMVQSLQKGERVVLKDVGLFADGAAVKHVGEESFRLCQEVVDEIIQVSTDETCAAIKDVFEDTRSIVEPAGALAVAGLKKYVATHPSADTSRNLVAIASGANMNFDRLRFVAERAALGEKKEALMSVKIPEKPGAFSELIKCIMPHMVTEFSYRYATDAVANVLVGISLTSPASQRDEELSSLLSRIRAGGMTPTDLSGDELAKSHVRYLVGGISGVPNERLYMFNFPERPGALEKFLATLRPRYNISLFQYRNAGSDIGKVLTGIVCPDDEVNEVEEFLRRIGYPYEDCTTSDVFKTFLRADGS